MIANRPPFTIGEALRIPAEQTEFYAEKLGRRDMIYAAGANPPPSLEKTFRMKITELNNSTALWSTGCDVPRGRDIERIFNIIVSRNDGHRCPCGFSIGWSVERCERCMDDA